MIGYTPTPDYYNDYIQHYSTGVQAKIHKYIKRWKNAAGKWVYQYKNRQNDKQIKKIRKAAGLKPEDVIYDRHYIMKNGKKYLSISAYTGDSGKARSTGWTSGLIGSKFSLAGVKAGRRRAGISNTINKVKKRVESGQLKPGSRKKRILEGTTSVKKGKRVPLSDDQAYYNNIRMLNAYRRSLRGQKENAAKKKKK